MPLSEHLLLYKGLQKVILGNWALNEYYLLAVSVFFFYVNDRIL